MSSWRSQPDSGDSGVRNKGKTKVINTLLLAFAMAGCKKGPQKKERPQAFPMMELRCAPTQSSRALLVQLFA